MVFSIFETFEILHTNLSSKHSETLIEASRSSEAAKFDHLPGRAYVLAMDMDCLISQ